MGKTKNNSIYVKRSPKCLGIASIMALVEIKSEGQFIVNMLKTHLEPHVSFPTWQPGTAPLLPWQGPAESFSGESKIRGYLDWGGGWEETSSSWNSGL